jgi:hypothetical protein
MSLPKTFAAGERLFAADLNSNFEYLDGAIDSIEQDKGVLQIVRAVDTTVRETTSSSFADAGISVSITPKFSDSVLYMYWNVSGESRRDGPTANRLVFQITDESNSQVGDAEGGITKLSDSGGPVNGSLLIIGQVVAGSTSARTYKGRFRINTTNFNPSGTIRNDTQTGQLFVWEVRS